MSEGIVIAGSVYVAETSSGKEDAYLSIKGNLTVGGSIVCRDSILVTETNPLEIENAGAYMQSVLPTPFGTIVPWYGHVKQKQFKNLANTASQSNWVPLTDGLLDDGNSKYFWYVCDGTPTPLCEANAGGLFASIVNLPDFRDRVLMGSSSGQNGQTGLSGTASFLGDSFPTGQVNYGGRRNPKTQQNVTKVLYGTNHTHSMSCPSFKSAKVHYIIYLGEAVT